MFETTVRVYLEHTDAGGIVYHSNYLNFMERCRSDWLESLGMGVVSVEKELGLQWVVRAIDIDYHAPARLYDELTVNCSVLQLGKVKLAIEQAVYNKNELLCSARIKLASVSNTSLRPLKMPENLINTLRCSG